MASNNRTEKATPRRRQHALEQGNLLRSREVSAALVFGGCFILFASLGVSSLRQSQESFAGILIYVLSTPLTQANLMGHLWVCGVAAAKLAGPVMAVAITLAVAGSVLQHGFHWSSHALTPNLAKLN